MPDVPDRSWFDPVLGAWLHTGSNAVEWGLRFPGGSLATDIETPGLVKSFVLNCVTMAWRDGDTVHSILLDPRRNPVHGDVAAVMYDRATAIVLHNAPFDVPGLHRQGLLDAAGIDKIVDTLVLARFADPDPTIRKGLSALCTEHLGWDELKGGMEIAFKAAGHRTQDIGYETMDIDSPIYRMGAMADTVGTLLLEPILRDKAIRLTLNHPFPTYGATTRTEAAAILHTQEVVHRVMLRRTAVGINVDLTYLTSYRERVHDDRARHVGTLAEAGLEGGSGRAIILMDYLLAHGELPDNWPRTATGKLKATKELLDGLEHPLAAAQRSLADTDKILGYLEAVAAQASVTGRCHPQVGVLGASRTGRMAYSNPALQQFPKEARPILRDDGQGLTSIDWSQIEPVTMALMAKDSTFLAPFEAGEDLYEPIQRAAGVTRDIAKVVLLATMYGQGTAGMAARIKHTTESAAQIRRQMLEAMPESGLWMRKVQNIAEDTGLVLTAGGRILPVPEGWVSKAVNWTVQGSAYDILAATIEEMDRQGIADHVHVVMHDEVVVSTTVAEEVQKIMESPPEFLIRRAGRIPILRSDRADMQHSWLKV